MSKNNQILATAPVAKLLFQYSLPTIIAMLINSVYNVIDRMLIGNIPGMGALATIGVGIAMPIMNIVLAFGILIGSGAVTKISLNLGEGNREEAEKTLGNAMSLSLIIGIVLTVGSIIFMDEMLKIFGASNESIIYARDYMNIIVLGSTFSIFSSTFNHLIRGDGSPKISARYMIWGFVVNGILDVCFIFVLDMGIKGAALGTVLAQIFTAYLGLKYYIGKKSNLKFQMGYIKADRKIILSIIAIGATPFFMQITASAIHGITNNMLSHYGGDLAIGAMTTISTVLMIVGMPVGGISQGAQPIIGYNFGAKQYSRAEQTLKLSIMSSTLFLTACWIVILAFPQGIASVFNPDEALIVVTANGLTKYLTMLPIMGMAMLGTNYMQAIGKAKEAMILILLRKIILLLPLVLILPQYIGLDGIWLSQPVTDLISLIITGVLLYKTIKSYKAI